jgi:thioredoxin reductase
MNPEQVDLLVVGAGPAGMCAAIEAARVGTSVLVVDEAARPGGQIYRQIPGPLSSVAPAGLTREQREGRTLFDQFERHGITFSGETIVWGSFDDRVLELANDDRVWRVQAKAIVVAAGAYDRPVPIPGWTLPGVLTVGAAQTMLKSQGIVPGRRILLAGTGPLLLVVASQLATHGANIVAVVDPVPAREALRHAAALLTGWPLLLRGLRYRWTLLKSRVPWIAPAVLTRVEGGLQVERATIARVDRDWRPLPGAEQSFEVDSVCVGYGLVPSVELLRLCGCELHYNAVVDAWIPRRSDEFETSVNGLFAVGDGAGIAGVAAARDEGRVAGVTIAHRLAHLSTDQAEARLVGPRTRLARLRRFRVAVDHLYRVRPGLRELITPETVVCRCEEVSRTDLTLALGDGAASLSQLKAWTRAGMGSCQARMCGLTTAQEAATELHQSTADLAAYTPRPPLKPVRIGALIAELADTDAGSIAGQGVKHE